MRAVFLAGVILATASAQAYAVVSIGLPNSCSDRNALQGMGYDARLTAIQLYFKGFTEAQTDKSRQACLETRVLMDERFAVINATRALVETDCIPIDVAARTALQGLCP